MGYQQQASTTGAFKFSNETQQNSMSSGNSVFISRYTLSLDSGDHAIRSGLTTHGKQKGVKYIVKVL